LILRLASIALSNVAHSPSAAAASTVPAQVRKSFVEISIPEISRR